VPQLSSGALGRCKVTPGSDPVPQPGTQGVPSGFYSCSRERSANYESPTPCALNDWSGLSRSSA
jgi:hypothetical protein